jgi:hypothetical protein
MHGDSVAGGDGIFAAANSGFDTVVGEGGSPESGGTVT